MSLPFDASDDDLVDAAVRLSDAAILDGHEMAPELRVVRDLWWLDAEVYNGGFHQFFFNSTGDRAEETLEACRAVGDEGTARLLERALATFVERPLRDRMLRHEQLKVGGRAQAEALAALDDEFQAAPSRTPLRAAYLRRSLRDKPPFPSVTSK